MASFTEPPLANTMFDFEKMLVSLSERNTALNLKLAIRAEDERERHDRWVSKTRATLRALRNREDSPVFLDEEL